MDSGYGEPSMSEEIETFRVEIDGAVLEDLRSRLDRTRFPDQPEDTAWPIVCSHECDKACH